MSHSESLRQRTIEDCRYPGLNCDVLCGECAGIWDDDPSDGEAWFRWELYDPYWQPHRDYSHERGN